MNDSLKNMRLLIVGGSSGIGLAVAKQACAVGAEVVIASRHASEKRDDLASFVGADIETYSFDITSESDTSVILDRVGAIDHLVITTRAESSSSPFVDTNIKQARQAFETKFWGTYQLIQKACGQINSHGSIVMTSGIAGEKTYKNFSTMATINSATEALCRSLALELSPIRVNAVSPGFVSPKPDSIEKYARQFPVARLATADEVASAYIHLMQSSYITGTSLVIDGGAMLV